MSEVALTTPTSGQTEVSQAVSLRQEIEAGVAAQSTTVRAKVVERRVQEELDRRTNLALQGLTKRDEASKALNKIKPDLVAYDASGKPVSENYSKAKSEELKKARALLTKIDSALAKAFASPPNYDELTKLVSGGNTEEKPDEAAA